MLWALLIALLIAKLSEGPAEVFLVDDLDKQIKEYVDDKDRKKEALHVVKIANKEIKIFLKFRKKTLKRIESKGSDQTVSYDQMMEEFQPYFDKRLTFQDTMIARRLALQEVLSDQEWEDIISKAVLPSEKERRKIEKSEGKTDKRLDKFHQSVVDAINESIDDEAKAHELVNYHNEFKLALDAFLEEGEKMGFDQNELVKSKSASQAEMKQYYEERNKLRYKGTEAYFKLRENARTATSEKEWQSISKALEGLYKQ